MRERRKPGAHGSAKDTDGNGEDDKPITERKLLPEGNVAVVEGISDPHYVGPDDGKGDRFWVNIGIVNRFRQEDLELAKALWGFMPLEMRPRITETVRGSEWMATTTLEDGVFIAVYPQGETTRLELLDISYDKVDPKRAVDLPSSFFIDHGFTLDTNDRSQIGSVLDPELSQRFYDLQVGQGEFFVPEKSPPPEGLVFLK